MRCLKSIILGLACFALANAASAGVLYVKLVDERENPVANAVFYFNYDPNGYVPFSSMGEQQGDGSLRRYDATGWIYNYKIGLGTSLSELDLKVVAPGYKVKSWTQAWPNTQDHMEDYIVVTLEREDHDH